MTGAVEPRLGIRVQAELGARAAAHEHEAGPLAARHVGGVVIGDKILEQAAAEGHRLTGLEETKVLEKVGHALQRPFGEPRRDRLARLPILLVYDGIDDRIDLFGPCDRSLQHLIGADLALGDEPGEGDGIVLPIFIEPHGPQISKLEPMENDYSCSDVATSSFMDDRDVNPLMPESWAGSQMLLREPSRHRIYQRSCVVGELMAFPALPTMLRHQHMFDARHERSRGTRGAEQHVRLKWQDNAIGLIAQDQDRTRAASG